MAAQTRKPDPSDFPAERENGTMIERAMRTAKSRSLVARPGDRPKGRTVKRDKKAKPKRPAVPSAKRKVEAPEAERSASISQALLKGAALVPESSISGTLRGLLGGASVGLDIEAALTRYNQRRRDATVANAAMQLEAGS